MSSENKENSRNFVAGARPLFLSRDIRRPIRGFPWISWKSIGQNAIGYALRWNETELPRQRAEAQEIRARRHAYERLPGSVKTEMNELEVFRAFEAVADIGIDAGSAQNAKAPEPDIWCAIDGNPHYFEHWRNRRHVWNETELPRQRAEAQEIRARRT